MLIGVNEFNEIVQVEIITDTNLIQIDLPEQFQTVESFQALTDFKVVFDETGNIIGRTVRGFKGEMENLWNARKELAEANEQIKSLKTQLQTAERVAAETSATQQDLIELLIDLGVM